MDARKLFGSLATLLSVGTPRKDPSFVGRFHRTPTSTTPQLGRLLRGRTSEEEAERRWAQVSEVRALGLTIPSEVGEDGEENLYDDEETLWGIARALHQVGSLTKEEDSFSAPASEKELQKDALHRNPYPGTSKALLLFPK